MKSLHLLGLVILCATFSAAFAQDQKKDPSLDPKVIEKKFEQLLPGMGAKDIGARFGPQQQWQAICYQAGAPGNETLRLEACKLMIAKLGVQTPDHARLWLLKQLEFLGRGESVDGVAALLKEKDALVHDAAVRCLANNPAPEATARLIAALPDAASKARIGLVNALGFRADKSAVDALADELKKPDNDAARAAAKALGKIASTEAMEVLARSLQDKAVSNDRRFWIADAYLMCADRRLREGKTAEAKAIYTKLVQSKDEPRSIHLAAFQGILKTAGEEAGPLILEAIAGNDADRKGIAIAQIESIGPGSLKHLAANIDKLPPPGQVILLGALAARGDKSQLPAALAAVKHKEESVQRAGILALGKLGDASVVGMLIDLTLTNAKLAGFAKDSLIALAGEGVDEKIVTGLKQEKNVANRKVLIAVLEARRAATAVPVLLEELSAGDINQRYPAMMALRQLAEPADIPALIRALLKTNDNVARAIKLDDGSYGGTFGERTEMEKTVVIVCRRIPEPEKQAEPVLDFVKKATAADKTALLPLLGRLGGSAASLEMIRSALASDNSELRGVGIVAICNWPEANVSEELVKLIQDAKTGDQHERALRSLIRVNSAPSEKPNNAARLEMLKKAMDLSANDDERRMVLDGLGYVKDIGTLRYVLPYLEQKNLAQAACKTIVELAHSKMLREPNMAEFERALDRVIGLCQDKGLIDRAKRYKQGF